MSTTTILHRLGLSRSAVATLTRQPERVRAWVEKYNAPVDQKPKGWANRAKLTPDQVREIRQRRANGEPYESLCAAFGITLGPMYRICSGESYRWVSKEKSQNPLVQPE